MSSASALTLSSSSSLHPTAAAHRHATPQIAQGGRHRTRCCAAQAQPAIPTIPTSCDTQQSQLAHWLRAEGAPEQAVQIGQAGLPGENTYSITVASRDIAEGEVIMRIPERLVITLGRIFADEAMGELLTTGKLSELACLTLYLMYEKKRGRSSPWSPLIKELDRTRGRGQMGAKTPLLWAPGQAERLLAGSPVLAEVKGRLQGIQKEYNELDTVWFMAGSLFNKYPYDIPTEAFSLELFTQGFAAVQSSVVHLQGVPLAKRFALVPFGPPLLAYSSTAKAMLRYDPVAGEVQFTSDRAYPACSPVYTWCGPQPNGRLLLNYGIVDETNPYDRLALTITLPIADPLYSMKRSLLQPHGLSTQQTFYLQGDRALPQNLLQYMRFAHTLDEASARSAAIFPPGGAFLDANNEHTILLHLATYLESRLGRYPTSIAEDNATVDSPSSSPREKVAARLLRIEKGILQGALHLVEAHKAAASRVMPMDQAAPEQVVAVRLSG